MIQPRAPGTISWNAGADLAGSSRESAPERGIVLRRAGGRTWVESRLDEGRTLMLFGAGQTTPAEWEDLRVGAEMLAAAGIPAPAPLPLTGAEGPERGFRGLQRPTLSTLGERWAGLDTAARAAALRSLGALLRKIHGVQTAGFGRIASAAAERRPLQWFLADELGVGSFAAIAQAWPEALGVVEGLLETIPEIAARTRGTRPCLVHNGLHLHAILCAGGVGTGGEGTGGASAVGVADPGRPEGNLPESDLAVLQLAHGPLSAQPLDGPWFETLLEGYGAAPDPVVLAFFRARHLVRRAVLAAGGERTPARTFPPSWLEAANADLEVVHAAFRERVRAAAEAAGVAVPRAEAQRKKIRRAPLRGAGYLEGLGWGGEGGNDTTTS